MEDRPYIMAVFSDEELPAAIGRNGQNIHLASQVTGYTIDAVKQSEYEGPKVRTIYLDELAGLSKNQVEVLARADIHTANEFIESAAEDILALKGFGPKTYEKVHTIISQAVSALADGGNEEVVEEDMQVPAADGNDEVVG
jgi:N utilization substance protein A